MKAVAFAGILLASSPALAQPELTLQPTEPSQTETFRWNDPKLRIGTALLLGGYARSVVWGQTTERERDGLYVPIAGPWLELFTLPACARDDLYCEHSGADRAMLVVDGLLQTGGLYLVLSSVFERRPAQRSRVGMAPASMQGPGVVVFGGF